MENLYALISNDSHEFKIWNLVWCEGTGSYCVYNIYKNNVESAHQFKKVEEFEAFLDERVKAGLIDQYYAIKI